MQFSKRSVVLLAIPVIALGALTSSRVGSSPSQSDIASTSKPIYSPDGKGYVKDRCGEVIYVTGDEMMRRVHESSGTPPPRDEALQEKLDRLQLAALNNTRVRLGLSSEEFNEILSDPSSAAGPQVGAVFEEEKAALFEAKGLPAPEGSSTVDNQPTRDDLAEAHEASRRLTIAVIDAIIADRDSEATC